MGTTSNRCIIHAKWGTKNNNCIDDVNYFSLTAAAKSCTSTIMLAVYIMVEVKLFAAAVQLYVGQTYIIFDAQLICLEINSALSLAACII